MTEEKYTASDVQEALERFEERGLEPAITDTGTKVHAADFDSDSALVRFDSDATDKLLCNRTGTFDRVEAVPTKPSRWCTTCLDKVLAPDSRRFLSTEGRT